LRHTLPDWRQINSDYYCDTGVFPIMMARSTAYGAHPWIAMELLKAFKEIEATDELFRKPHSDPTGLCTGKGSHGGFWQ
jgi:hypothetical protein